MTWASPGQGEALTALNKTLALTGPQPSEAMGSGSLVDSEMLGSLFTPSSSSGWEGAMAGTYHFQGVLRLCWCGSQWPCLSLWHLGTTHIPAGVAMPRWVCGAAGWAWGEFRRDSGSSTQTRMPVPVPSHMHASARMSPLPEKAPFTYVVPPSPPWGPDSVSPCQRGIPGPSPSHPRTLLSSSSWPPGPVYPLCLVCPRPHWEPHGAVFTTRACFPGWAQQAVGVQ